MEDSALGGCVDLHQMYSFYFFMFISLWLGSGGAVVKEGKPVIRSCWFNFKSPNLTSKCR